tara:strand:- start:787 stop:1128 length:342 start_codon:yes stop_codon:yes gene_type:complete
MPSTRFSVTQTGVSTTAGYTSVLFPDTAIRPFAIGIGCVVNSTTVVYSVQHSFDYTGSSTFISTAATWFNNAGITNATSNVDSNYIVPVSAVRLAVTAGSSAGTVTMTCIQAG